MNIPEPSKPLRGNNLQTMELLSILEQIEEPYYYNDIGFNLFAEIQPKMPPGKLFIVSTPKPGERSIMKDEIFSTKIITDKLPAPEFKDYDAETVKAGDLVFVCKKDNSAMIYNSSEFTLNCNLAGESEILLLIKGFLIKIDGIKPIIDTEPYGQFIRFTQKNPTFKELVDHYELITYEEYLKRFE